MDDLLWLKIWDLANAGVTSPQAASGACQAIIDVMQKAQPRPVQ